MISTLIPIILCIISAVVFICLGIKRGKLYGLISKIIASACFVGAGIYAVLSLDPDSFTSINMQNHPDWAWFLVAGLVFGLIGDIFMELKEQNLSEKDLYLNTGMLSFGIGHFMYFAGLTLCTNIRCNILIPTAIAIVLGLIITLFVFTNASSFGIKWGKFKWQSFAYSLVLSIMFAYSIVATVLDHTRWIFAVAMTLFFISDVLLSLIYFADRKSNTLRALNWGTYYLAQILVVLFIFLI